MSPSTDLYRNIKYIKDDRFDIDSLHHYDLSLIIGDRDFQLCVIDQRENRCLIIEDYILSSYTSEDEKIEMLAQLFESHTLLMAGFWNSVKLAVKGNHFSMVPCHLFDEEFAPEYLQHLSPVSPDQDFYFSYRFNYAETTCVFSANRKTIHWIRSHYPNLHIQIVHQSAALLEGLLHHNQEENLQVNLMIDRFKLHVMVHEGTHLKYYNQFLIKTFEDYIRYSLIAFHEFGLNPKENAVRVSGFIKEGSAHLEELRKHFTHIQLAEKPSHIKFSFHFDEVEDHQYIDLLHLSLCE